LSRNDDSNTRAKLANLFAATALLSLALTPWWLSDSSIRMSRSLDLPERFTQRLPERCRSVALYVGYPGCNTECPRALTQVALEFLSQPSAEGCAVFLNMFPITDEEPARYAQRFHPEFIDVGLHAEPLSSLLRQLGAEGALAANGTHKDLIYTLHKRRRGWELTEVTPATRWRVEPLDGDHSGAQTLK